MTTILAVVRDGKVAIGGDGQVTLGETVIKHKANKLRTLMGGKIVVGFAGATADAFSLLERFEATVKKCQGNLKKAAVELAKEWRTDRVLRRLNSVLLAVDKQNIFLISGSGDVIEPDEGVAAVGSGAAYALAAARALLKHSKLDAKQIVQEALNIVANICVYTNADIHVEVLE